MKDVNYFFSKSLRWISFEALSYQGLLLAHQLVLFRVCDYKTYGLIGAIFALIFLFVTLADFGLEMSISPFFSTITQKRNTFLAFIAKQLLPSVLTIVASTAILVFLKHRLPGYINLFLLLVFAGIVLSETIKKTLRTTMHIAFLNKAVAFIELGTIVSYVGSVWTLYTAGFHINLGMIFIPMLITSWLSNITMAWSLYKFSFSLPQKNPEKPKLKSRIIKSRSFNYLNQLTHLLFSSNFLVPFFAFQFGLAHAGVFKLVSHIAYCLTGVLRKTFGVTSDALLAKTKNMTIETKRAVFLRLTQKLHHALYGIIIFFSINYNKIIAYKETAEHPIYGPTVFLFLIICLSESLFIAYEKFYIAQERSDRLLFFNVVTMILTYGVIRSVTNSSELVALLAIIAVRAVMFTLLSLFSFYTWKIKPQWRLQPKYLAAALGTAVSFFFLF